MTIAHLSMKVGKAGKALPHAAYIARVGQYANRLEKGERLEAMEAGNMLAWAQSNPLLFWESADANERANGTTYREMEIALPREMTPEQRIDLVREWVQQELGARYAYQWAIHVPVAADGLEQPHLHLMFSERQLDGIERDPDQYFKRYNSKAPERGGARKGYGPNAGQTLSKADRVDELKALRSRWEATCNDHMERAGHAQRIDMRSYADQGRNEEPEAKQLPSQWRKPQQRANVIEFRAAKAALHVAKQAVQSLIPHVKALTTAILTIQEARQEIRKARPDSDPVAKLSSVDLVREWERLKKELVGAYRQRARKLEDQLWSKIKTIAEKRDAHKVAHQKRRPEEPQGMLAAFKRKGYEEEFAIWKENSRRIDIWLQPREKDLRTRAERVKQFVWSANGFAMERAGVEKLKRRHPDLAAKQPEAQAELKREQQSRQQEARQQQRLQNRTRGGGIEF